MAEQRRAENLGEALLTGVAQGFANLPGFLQTERENRMEKLMFLMKAQAQEATMQEHQARMEQLSTDNQLANLKLQDANQMAADPAGYAKRKAIEEAQAKSAGNIAGAKTAVGGLMTGTPIGNILESIGRPANTLDIGQLQTITGQQGMPVDWEKLGIGIPKPQQQPINFADVLAQANQLGLVQSGMGITAGGEKTFQFARPTEGQTISPEELQKQQAFQMEQKKKDIFRRASDIWDTVPIDIKQDKTVGVFEIDNIKDLERVLLSEKFVPMQRKFFGLIDPAARDINQATKNQYFALKKLLQEYRNIGVGGGGFGPDGSFPTEVEYQQAKALGFAK